jgi:cytochrome c peroxidase
MSNVDEVAYRVTKLEQKFEALLEAFDGIQNGIDDIQDVIATFKDELCEIDTSFDRYIVQDDDDE